MLQPLRGLPLIDKRLARCQGKIRVVDRGREIRRIDHGVVARRTEFLAGLDPRVALLAIACARLFPIRHACALAAFRAAGSPMFTAFASASQ